MLWSSVIAALITSPIHAKEIRVPALPIKVAIPDVDEATEISPWNTTTGDASMSVKLAMRNTEAFTDVTFQNTTYQPDLALVAQDFAELLSATDDEELQITPGEVRTVEHEVLGEMLVLDRQVRDNFLERDLMSRAVLFAVEGAGVLITATSSIVEEPDHVNLILDDVLSMIQIMDDKGPVPSEELPSGTLTTDAGYSVRLPSGWRALTEGEQRLYSTTRIAGDGHFTGKYADIFVVDTTKLEEQVFTCSASADGTLEILPPERSQLAKDNFLTFARVQLRGGRYRLVSGTDDLTIDVSTDFPVQPNDDGTLQFLSLKDREAYLWQVEGDLYGDSVKAALFYTTYADVGLTCVAIEEEGDEGRLGSFVTAMRDIEIVDGELYPMPLSIKAKYVRWWPYSHPLLQLYWVPVPIFLVAGWLVLKD